jgi:hypothetical protein
MLRVLRTTWRAALLASVMLALAPAVAAPASAAPSPAAAAPTAPTQTEIEAGLATFVASLPPPSRTGTRPITKMITLSGTGASTQLVVTCIARSILTTVGVQGFNYEIAESSTECPVAIDYVAAQTWLFKLDTFLNEWIELTGGPPDGHPGLLARSQTFQYACSADEALYAAVGYHYVRLGQSTAVGYTFYPGASKCRLQP